MLKVSPKRHTKQEGMGGGIMISVSALLLLIKQMTEYYI